jgi:hypothetical protein
MRPRREHESLAQASAVEGVLRSVHHQRDGQLRAGDMTGELTELRERAKRVPIAHHDQVPRLRVLRGAGPASDVEHVAEHVVGDRPVGEPTDDSKRSEESGELVRHG